MNIYFTKATAAGNDFVIIDNRANTLTGDITKFVNLIADRRFGIGADGVILIEYFDGSYQMKYFNSDGGLGSLCGNGARSTSKFIYERIEKMDKVYFSALGKNYSAIVKNDTVRLFLPELSNSFETKLLNIAEKEIETYFIDTGSPHAVIFTDMMPLKPQLDEIDVYHLGKEIRHSEAFKPAGTNVNFVKIESNNEISIRTFERGVEDETLACGTGSIASAIISSFIKKLDPPININNKGGEKFIVGFENTDNVLNNLFLEGKAKLVFDGTFEFDFKKNEMNIIL